MGEELMARTMTQTELRTIAQAELMHGIGNVLGYWRENPPDGAEGWSVEDEAAYTQMLRKQADRVARLLGFEQAWSN